MRSLVIVAGVDAYEPAMHVVRLLQTRSLVLVASVDMNWLAVHCVRSLQVRVFGVGENMNCADVHVGNCVHTRSLVFVAGVDTYWVLLSQTVRFAHTRSCHGLGGWVSNWLTLQGELHG